MDIRHVPDEINSRLRPDFQELVRKIRAGEELEGLIKQFVQKVHQLWTEKAVEYAKMMEEQRKRDRMEMEQKLEAMKNAFEQERHENRQILCEFSRHLNDIEQSQRDHEKFVNLRGEALIESFGRFSSALDALLERHEDVEIAKSNEEFLRGLRAKCQEMVSQQNTEIREILCNKISTQLPIASVCDQRHQIVSEVQKINDILFNLNSQVATLTPDYWTEENVLIISQLKTELEVKTGNLLRMISESEASHKKKMQGQLVFKSKKMIAH